MMSYTLYHGDCLDILPTLEAGSFQTCVTSPPYFGLRDYGVDGQVGLERTPNEYVAKLVDVFRGVWRVLKDDGTLWLNLGDSYASGEVGRHDSVQANQGREWSGTRKAKERKQIRLSTGLAQKQLLGIPWRVALALQADGWYLRSDIIWHKPNPMPESVTDRPTKAHEYLFLLAKQEKYYYNADAVREPSAWLRENNPDWQYQRAITNEKKGCGNRNAKSGGFSKWTTEQGRNRRTVWTIATTPYSGAHFAVMPPKLVEPCILAGSRPGDLVLDPFVGSGTVGAVALENERRFVGIDLNAEYIGLAQDRLAAASQQLRIAV